MKDTIIDLIRHGEPEGGSKYRGHAVDDPLSEKGWRQMWTAVGEHHPWDLIVTSPLQRCRAFAEALGERHSIAVMVIDNLKEIGFGSWEGKTPAELKASNKAEFEAFYHDPVNVRPVGAENLDAFVQRVGQAYDAVVAQHEGKHVLLVAHAGVNRAIIAKTVFAEHRGIYRIKVDNAGITRIRHNQFGGMLEFHNKGLY